MDNSLQQKQDFLSKEILQAGYDPEEFQEFMLSQSDRELDLNLWGLSQLKSLVVKFKLLGSQRQGLEAPSQSQSQAPNKVIEEEIRPQIGKKQSIENADVELKKMQAQGQEEELQNKSLVSHSVNSSLYRYYTLTEKTMKTDLYIRAHIQKKKVSIKIRDYSKTVPNNIFKSSYICYNIECSEGWKVSRRFNDFIWLCKYLNSAYPGLPLPPIPAKTTVRSYDQKHIEFRMAVLERYLGHLISMPQVCSDEILETFLRVQESLFSQMKKTKDQELAQRKAKGLLPTIWGEDLIVEGVAGIETDQRQEFEQFEKNCQKLYCQLSVLQQSLQKVVRQSELVSETYQQIQLGLKASKCTGICSVMSQYFQHLSFHLAKTSELLKEDVQGVWNFQNMNLCNLNQAINKIVKEQQSLTHKHKTVMMRIAERDEGEDFSVSTLEPNRQLKEYQAAKERYKIRLSYLVRELERYQKENLRGISEEWTGRLKKYIGDISEWMIGCTDQLTRSMSLAEGKELMEVQYSQYH